MTSSKFCITLSNLEHVMAHTSILSQLLQKVDINLRTAVNCVNNLQSLMMTCRDVSNNDTNDEIYQKVADMVSSEEISMPRIVNHQCVVTYQQNHLRIIISQPLRQIFGKCDFAVRSTIFWSC